MAFTHVSIREGIYNSLTDSLKRLVTRNAIDYLEKQCTIVCRTCGPRNDSPLFIQKQDDLTRIIKTNHQHAFVDIVKMAALKEIDNTIKYLVKIRSLNVRTKQRSNTSSNVPQEPTTTPIVNSNRLGNSSNSSQEKRRNSFDTSGFELQRARRSESPRRISSEVEFGIKLDRTIHHDSNFTEIIVHPCENNQSESISSPVQIEVQQRSNPPERRNRFLKSIDDLMRTNKSNRNEITKKQVKSTRFQAFLRFIFCRFASSHSRTSTSLEINNQSVKNSNGTSRIGAKLSVISQVMIQCESKVSSPLFCFESHVLKLYNINLI
jgi:hypothetical protein